MASEAAKLLDELMGRDRNVDPSEARREVRWEDNDVCKFYLCGFCPHELFTNTRADLGPCDKIHDEDLKKQYEESSRYDRMGYADEFLRFLQTLLTDVERRIKRGHQRLQLNNMQLTTAMLNNDKSEQIEMLTKRINDLVDKAEQLGCEGRVEEAQGVMKLCERLKEERTELEEAAARGQAEQEELAKKMEVCETCGSLLVANDTQQRVDEHLLGKQHMGYARIRAFIEERKMKAKQQETEREDRLRRQREEREREREKEREERRKREAAAAMEREKERERRRRRSRSRSRERRRDRSRDRDRRRRSRSGEKHRSSRHSSRERDRERRRSRSRDRKRASRDKDKSSKDRDRSSRDNERRSSRDRDGERKEEDGHAKDQSGDGDSDRSASMEMERNSASKQAEMGSGDGENVAENNHETVSQN